MTFNLYKAKIATSTRAVWKGFLFIEGPFVKEPYKDLVSIVNSTLEVLSLVTMYMQRLRYDKVDAILSCVLL